MRVSGPRLEERRGGIQIPGAGATPYGVCTVVVIADSEYKVCLWQLVNLIATTVTILCKNNWFWYTAKRSLRALKV